jgi:hypothetical protein
MRGLDNIFSVRAEPNCFHATVTIDTFKTNVFKKKSIFLKYHFMVTTYPPLHRMSMMTIAGAFHFPLDHARSFRKENYYTSASAANLDFKK